MTATGLEPRTRLATWLSVCLRTKWFWVRVQLQSLHLQISRLLRARSSMTFRQLQSVDSLWNAYVTWQEHTVKIMECIELNCVNISKRSEAIPVLNWVKHHSFPLSIVNASYQVHFQKNLMSKFRENFKGVVFRPKNDPLLNILFKNPRLCLHKYN